MKNTERKGEKKLKKSSQITADESCRVIWHKQEHETLRKFQGFALVVGVVLMGILVVDGCCCCCCYFSTCCSFGMNQKEKQ